MNNSNVEIGKGVYTCKQFAQFIRALIKQDYEGINYDNFEIFKYKRKYKINSQRFSVDSCYKELNSELTPSDLWGTGVTWTRGETHDFIYPSLLFADNSILTDGFYVQNTAFRYYIPNKDERNLKLKAIKEKYKNDNPFDINILDPLNKAKL